MQYRPRDYSDASATKYGIERRQYDGRYMALFGADAKLVMYDTAAERDTELDRLNGTAPEAPAPTRAKKGN